MTNFEYMDESGTFHKPIKCAECECVTFATSDSARAAPAENPDDIVHWIRSTPITKPAEARGLMCGTPYRPERMRASSYREHVTCKLCLLADK